MTSTPSASPTPADYSGIIIDACNPSNWDSTRVTQELLKGKVTGVNATTAIWEGFVETLDANATWQKRFREAGNLLHVKQSSDLQRAHEEGKLGVILGWQNISPIEDSIERLEIFHALGVRIIQLAYNVRNLVANGCYEPSDSGLSLFGLKAVKKLNELGILIDLSHVGDHSSLDAIEASEQPVAFTHIQLREYYNHPRNKPRDVVRALVQKGGVVGANAFPQFLPNLYESTLGEYVDGLEKLLEVTGIDHIGIASDQCHDQDWAFFDKVAKIHGTTPHFPRKLPYLNPTVKGLERSSDMPRIAAELRNRGYSQEEVHKIMGGNWKRLFAEVWGA